MDADRRLTTGWKGALEEWPQGWLDEGWQHQGVTAWGKECHHPGDPVDKPHPPIISESEARAWLHEPEHLHMASLHQVHWIPACVGRFRT